MKKRIFIVAGVLALLALVGAILWLVAPPKAPASLGTIPLPDHSWVQLEAVTYGTNHLVGPRLAFLIKRLPQAMQPVMRRVFGRHAAIRSYTNTRSPQLVLWLNRGPNSIRFLGLGDLRCVITDTNGFPAGEEVYFSAPRRLEAKTFRIFPRRDPEFLLKIYHHDPQGKVTFRGEIRIANPIFRNYPKWQPESLPATRQVGDMDATLHRVIANASQNSGARRQRDGRMSVEVRPVDTNQMPNTLCHLSLRSLVSSYSEWGVAGVEVSDATGNRTRSGNLSRSGEGKDLIVRFSPGLWTNESAWKLAFEIKRTSGFQPDEQFTFHNVPLGRLNETNSIGWRTNFNGVTVTLRSIERRPPAIENLFSPRNLTRVEFAISGLTNNLHLDMTAARASNGTNLHRISWGGDSRGHSYEFNNVPSEADTVDFTFAVHTNRTVQFLVKPEVATESTQIRVEPE
jgi:hypothetical protein